MKNPYTTVSSKVAYKTPWMKIIEDKITHRDGKGIYSYVDKPASIVVVALTAKKEIYLVGQWRYPIKKYSWELPMGRSEKGESMLTGAKRELQEEIDRDAKQWKKLGKFYLADGTTNQLMHNYLAQDLHDAPGVPDDSEYLSVKKVSVSKIKKMIQHGDIFDGPTITAFYQFLLATKL